LQFHDGREEDRENHRSARLLQLFDTVGDQVFEEFMTNGPISLGSPIVFKGKWLGGTGKFERTDW
jgi:hypothetical protein